MKCQNLMLRYVVAEFTDLNPNIDTDNSSDNSSESNVEEYISQIHGLELSRSDV